MRIRRAGLIAGITLVFGLTSISAISSRVSPRSSGASGYHVAKTIPIGGDGPWDYCIVDSAARRVYISQFTHVVVLNADTGAIVGDIPDTQGVHGVALAPGLGLGFTSNGHANTVTVFDLKSLKTIRTVATGGRILTRFSMMLLPNGSLHSTARAKMLRRSKRKAAKWQAW